MPTYDYECTECGYKFEYFQAMSDDPLSTCPQCGSRLRRLIGGGTGIIFKGSGFYVTDNGKKKSASEKTDAPEKTGASTGKSSKDDAPSKNTASPDTSSGQGSESKSKSEKTVGV